MCVPRCVALNLYISKRWLFSQKSQTGLNHFGRCKVYRHKNKIVITNKILLLVEKYSYQNYRTNIFEITLAYAVPLTRLSFNRIMNLHSTNRRYEFAIYNQHVINNRRFRFETKESNRKFNIRHQFAHNGFHMLLTSNKQVMSHYRL